MQAASSTTRAHNPALTANPDLPVNAAEAPDSMHSKHTYQAKRGPSLSVTTRYSLERAAHAVVHVPAAMPAQASLPNPMRITEQHMQLAKVQTGLLAQAQPMQAEAEVVGQAAVPGNIHVAPQTHMQRCFCMLLQFCIPSNLQPSTTTEMAQPMRT